MVDYNKVPKEGLIYAVFPKQIIFDFYVIKNKKIFLNKRQNFLNLNSVRELHLFNKEKEYRLFYQFGKLKTVIIDEEYEKQFSDDCIYHENVIIKDAFYKNAKLHVVSYFEYTQNDTLSLKNYRLVEIIDG